MRMHVIAFTAATLLGGAPSTVVSLDAQTVVRAPAVRTPAAVRTQASFTTTSGSTEDLERYLFTPELIMRHYREIGLEPDQREVITRAVEELQVGLVDLQWRLMEATQQLEEALAPSSVEQTRALTLVDQVLAMEREVKTRHLTALIRIKNALTEEQQEALSARQGVQVLRFGTLSPTGVPGVPGTTR